MSIKSVRLSRSYLQNDDNEGHQRLDDTELKGALFAKPDRKKTSERAIQFKLDWKLVDTNLRNPML